MYIINEAKKVKCPNCGESMYFLSTEDVRTTAFYICWECKEVRQLGHGKVKESNGE